MLYFDSSNPAPNPRRVRIFAAEKRVDLPSRDISIQKGEHKTAEFLAINPLGQTPALQLSNGTVITESLSICRYLEALYPNPSLFGNLPVEIGEIDMWSRRVEMILMAPVGAVWMHTHAYTKALPGRNPEYGEANRDRVEEAFRFFDQSLQDREFLAGERYSVADIVLLTTMDFSGFAGCPAPEDCAALKAWHKCVSDRPSASA